MRLRQIVDALQNATNASVYTYISSEINLASQIGFYTIFIVLLSISGLPMPVHSKFFSVPQTVRYRDTFLRQFVN